MLCVAAETMFSTLLGAYEENYKDLAYLREGCPYGRPIEAFDYQGACTHSAFREDLKLLNGKPVSAFRGNKDILKMLSGEKPTEGNGDDPKYTVGYWRSGLKEYSTYHLQPVGKKRAYDFTMSKYSENDRILDIDSMLGIERDEPVLSKIPQRTTSTVIPEGPERRTTMATRRTTEAAKAKHREAVREWSNRPEVKDKRKAKYWEKKNTSTEEEKEKVWFYRGGL